MGNPLRSNRIHRNGYFKLNSKGLNLVKYLMLGIALMVKSSNAESKACRNFKSARSSVLYEEIIPKTFSKLCPPTASPYNIYLVDDSPDITGNGEENLTLLVCWTNDVRRFALQFDDNVLLDTSTSGPVASVRTCAVPNDTVTHNHRHHIESHRLLLNIPTASEGKFRAYFDTRKKFAYRKHVMTYKFKKDGPERRRRSPDEKLDVTDVAECGRSRSCVRYGPSDCGHFSCQYFLSTNVTGSDVDIEISAKTNGWTALGLSSDKKMGGDEVIACYKTNPVGSEIRAGTFQNPYSHDPPKPKNSDAVKLLYATLQDGYLYCRLTRPESPSGHQDLSAKWYQLYGYGPVSQDGELEKHKVTPMVSDKMISLVHTYDIIGGCSIVTASITLVLILTGLSVIFHL